MRSRTIWLNAVFMLTGAGLAVGHSGGLDANGGHYNRKTGEYHYHRSPPSRQVAPPIASRVGAVSSVSPTSNPLPEASDLTLNDRDLVMSVQLLLTTLGYEIGPADGTVGPKTAEAIRDFQSRRSLHVDAEVSGQLLVRLSAAVLEKFGGQR